MDNNDNGGTMQIKSVQLIPSDTASRRGSIIYVSIENESVLDNLRDRRSRPYALYRRLITEAGVLESLGVPGVHLKWNQRAGCSCPCSPGFEVVNAKAPKASRHLLNWRQRIVNAAGTACNVYITI